MNRLSAVLSILILALAFASCHDDVLTQSSAQPTIALQGKDCFDFGSLLSGSTSATLSLMIYNQNDGTIELQSVALRGGKESPFKINVDGMAGSSFTQSELLRIDKGDSLYVLLDVTAPAIQAERENILQDYLDVTCNGKTTSIQLKALSIAVETLRDFTLAEDLRWDAQGLDKQIFGTLTIPEGRKLIIADSAKLFMHDQSKIEVFGSLIIEGLPEHPVAMLGDRMDKMFSNLYYCDMTGQWGGIHYHNTSSGNVIDRADIKGMTQGIIAEGAQLDIRNSIFKNSNQSILKATASTVTIENSCLMNSGEPLVDLTDGSCEITHCTLANYQFWTYYPEFDFILHNTQCTVTNTIIYGNGADPNVKVEYEPDVAAPYLFDHCLLNAKGEDDDNFKSTIWGDDPLFMTVDMPNYICDPHLKPESPARGAGTSSTIKKLPLDLDGKPRAETPSIGCYE